MEVSLNPLVVVIADVVAYGCNELCPACELPAVVCLPLQDSPESFHWPVVDAVRNTGHAMRASMLLHNGPELCAGVLESAIAVAERMCIRF